MNTKKTSMILIPVLVAFCAITAQASGPIGMELADKFPGDALVYIESVNLSDQLSTLLQSKLLDDLLKSRAWADFTRSKLFTKLGARRTEMEEFTGFGLSLDNLQAVSGGRSALALYDIGELKFLFVTRMSEEKIIASGIWALREEFESRKSADGSVTIYVKEDEAGRASLAFARVDDLFLIGSDILRIEQQVALIKSGGDSLANDAKFTAAIPPDGSFQDAVIYLDQEHIRDTSYFRVYWLYDNQVEIGDVNSAVICIDIAKQGIRETRWFRRENPRTALNQADGIASRLPAAMDHYRLGRFAPGYIGAFMCGEFFTTTDQALVQAIDSACAGAAPGEFGVAATAEPAPDKLSFDVHKRAVIYLETPGQLDTAALEGAVSAHFTKMILGEEDAPAFSFADDGGFRVLNIPLVKERAFAYRLDGNFLIAGIGIDPSSTKRAGVSLGGHGGDNVAYAMLDLGSLAKHTGDYLRTIGGGKFWNSGSNAVFFRDNVAKLLEIMAGHVKTVRVTGWNAGEFEVHRVEYER